MASLLTSIHDRRAKACSGIHDAHVRLNRELREAGLPVKYVDVTIQFIGASGLPKMDVVGCGDPYFVAKLDDQIKYTSTIQVNTLAPVWNEVWHVKNAPAMAVLHITVLDKDDGPTDDIIGHFHTILTTGAKEIEIRSSMTKRIKGTFWLKAHSIEICPPYTFDGPVRFSRHFSPTVGRLTNLNDERLYSTWKVSLKGVPSFFGNMQQHWNTGYKAAQTIFGVGPASFTVRQTIKTAHSLLYARSTRNGFGTLDSPKDVLDLLHGGPRTSNRRHRVKPAVYTYVITLEGDTFRFSETGAAFFVDFASKHALHANCAEAVRYSGEFHPRPKGGWENFSDERNDADVEWELVIDNNSGTYSPDKNLLPALEACLLYNFPWFTVTALDHEDPALTASREACRAYALRERGVKQEELQPHTAEGEETLMHAIGAGARAEEHQVAEGTAEMHL
ncbi:hypothetical protein K488DRAFT_43034 [Vararia minispora EC-137]|uniref:Uncharacterized protein n=1 Tax=Vararia minispora EC-137 TaxID=1314806 RepID=A0ACB8QVU6_9AGAM|nr:hypothetical protein K488DRAFT_43034 [Vararia minispora EC-137]